MSFNRRDAEVEAVGRSGAAVRRRERLRRVAAEQRGRARAAIGRQGHRRRRYGSIRRTEESPCVVMAVHVPLRLRRGEDLGNGLALGLAEGEFAQRVTAAFGEPFEDPRTRCRA